MQITVNGKPFVLTAPMTISDFIESRQLNPATIVIEFNGAVVASDSWPSLSMQENDKLEIITFVGGG
ncbi:sulfur carrier protein ThiS [Propionispora hippei]|uniref:sulfur carrier protein ThiS n=1 Tax=Propionispora hippei TaxID=209080 RepID=UPI001CB72224|nr:sulfur carrier protein ThiS [Propionispora hippei]